MSQPVIVFAGDSLTADGNWGEWFPEAMVHNLGVAGSTSDDVVEHVDDVIGVHPDTIVLLIGTNDLARRATVEHVVRNIETILVTLRRKLPETRILVQSVMPREPEYAPTIAEINRHLWQFAPTVHAGYLDLWPVLADEEDTLDPRYSEDRLNLNEAGYQAWLAALVPALEELAVQPTTTRSLPIVTGQINRVDRHEHS